MTLRADLHVHTCYSKSNTDIAFLRSRDCYSRPLDVYRTADGIRVPAGLLVYTARRG